MNDTQQYKIIPCATCGVKNKVKEYTGGQIPVCGQCGRPFTTSPFSRIGWLNKLLIYPRKAPLIIISMLALIGLVAFAMYPRKHNAPSPTNPTKIAELPKPSEYVKQPVETALDFKAQPQPQPQPLPLTEVIKKSHKSGSTAPLTISTRSGAGHYFVKVVDWDTTIAITDLFIREGETVKTYLPLGSYKIKYATGKTWYGAKLLFGSATTYNEADQRFDFVKEGNQILGFTVELFLQRDGNLFTKQISVSDW